ncbi:MAG: YifB family Mg chelatase-like AAA ATPase [Actinobacteria bacterium]|nr:YifB family Mg chelatase-like AAA ATPase [Actinomycetota bacterium]
MLASIASEALSGLEGKPVQVEADVVAAAPAFSIVGLPDAAVQESRERVRAAIVNSAYAFPSRRITVNLAPADLRKEGPSFDLPIALAFLVATGQAADGCDGRGPLAALGELGLDGALRPVAGALALAESLRRRGMRGLILPAANAAEAALVGGLEVYPARTLAEAVAQLAAGGGAAAPPADLTALLGRSPAADADFADIMGQEQVKRALEVAVAGAHNVLMSGPPGAGKTMLARRLPGIMPALTLDEAIEVTRIHSVAGLLPQDGALITQRPFRAPHHTISSPGLVGGGGTPRPGEVSLGHLGVLFLDEFAEFRLSALEGLRQPLEDGEVTISRRLVSLTFPARIMLVAAMNPCPCGYLGDRERGCTCPAHRVRQYGSRLSGPLLDRIDLRLDVPRVSPQDRRGGASGEPSAVVRARVAGARERQLARLAGTGVYANAHMSARHLRRLCSLDADATALLDRAYERLRLSARACDRVIKVAQTIADLEAAPTITWAHVAESLSYRNRSQYDR